MRFIAVYDERSGLICSRRNISVPNVLRRGKFKWRIPGIELSEIQGICEGAGFKPGIGSIRCFSRIWPVRMGEIYAILKLPMNWSVICRNRDSGCCYLSDEHQHRASACRFLIPWDHWRNKVQGLLQRKAARKIFSQKEKLSATSNDGRRNGWIGRIKEIKFNSMSNNIETSDSRGFMRPASRRGGEA